MKVIQVVFQNKGFWITSHYTSNKDQSLTPDKQIIQLFGTHNLDSNFPISMCKGEVAELLQSSNPDAIVEAI